MINPRTSRNFLITKKGQESYPLVVTPEVSDDDLYRWFSDNRPHLIASEVKEELSTVRYWLRHGGRDIELERGLGLIVKPLD